MAAFDVVIKGGTVVDGTGAPGRQADVGVMGERITVVGDLPTVGVGDIVEAPGCVVCPGFIDMHTHSDLTPLMDTRSASKVRQGVTTQLVGHCGFSAFPLVKGTIQEQTELGCAVMMGGDIEADWSDCAGYLAALERARPAFNMATLIGGGTVRSAVVGYDNRPPGADELEAMRRLVAEAMEQGAFGLSSGLTLYPSSVAQTDELVALCEELAEWGGLYDTHTRYFAGRHVEAVEEAIEIGRRAGVPVQVAHLAITEPRYRGQGAQFLAAIMESAQFKGVDLTFDAYPYVASGFPPSELMPAWVQDGGTEAMLDRLGLTDRGRLREGCVADLVIFDPIKVHDQATFAKPHRYPAGISHVMVNGQWVVRDGEQTDARPGQILRHVGSHR